MADDRGVVVARGLQGARIALLALGLALGCAAPPEVEVLHPVRGDLQRSFTEQARTRLTRTWLVAMPVTGHLSRVAVDEGDAVRAGQRLASVDPVPLQSQIEEASAQVREARARGELQQDVGFEEAQQAQALARVHAERETARALRAQLRTSEARLRDAETDRGRMEGLLAQGFVTRQDTDDARVAAVAAEQRLRELYRLIAAQDAAVAEAERQVAVYRRAAERRRREEEVLEQTEQAALARLRQVEHEADRAAVQAPVSGLVLRRFEQGPGDFAAGTKLLEIGRLEDLEVVAEVLTGDALLLRKGMPVSLLARDGASSFPGLIREIEPAGFTKNSSLGVEQQRVEVMIRVPRPPQGLGVGWRVAATFVTGKRQGVLLLPRFSVLQDELGGYRCFVVEGDRLVRRTLRLGLQGDARLEVLEGVSEADTVVAVPDATLREGERVKPVEQAAP